mmetsp:Transcript_94880/g.152983  ORF Transcript_94880/g.152983 Transcript_94880/m.152983 type:complete len:613 (-) Transcript_94880:378-2216(-)
MTDGDSPDSAPVVGDDGETPQAPAVPLGPFNLPVLKIIVEGQGLHGLRYGDYQRYRQYCARRMQRLRKGLNFVHWETGKGKSKFVQRVIEEDTVVDERYLQLVLHKAERSWAYAMQLRDPPGGVPGREVHHMARLLAKAVKHSAHLESLARSKADDRSVLESEAYASWMAGTLFVEQEKWDFALQKLSRCRTVYDEMQNHAPSGPDKDMYQKRVDELDPLIRYCRYNVSREGGGRDLEADSLVLMEIGRSAAGGDMLRGKVEKSLADTRLKQAASGHEIEWLGEKIKIENPSIHQHILAAEGLQYELDQMLTMEDKIAAYDKIFMALDNAKSCIRDDISKNLQKGAQGDESLTTTLQQVRNKVQAAVLNRTRERDLLLVEQLQVKLQAVSGAGDRKQQERKATKPEDLVKMFETLLNATEELAAIPGIKEHAAMAKLCAARTLMFKAWRVMYLGVSYLAIQRFAQAFALFARCEQLEKVARQRLHETDARDAVDDVWLDKLNTAARLAKAETRAAATTFAATASTSSASAASDYSSMKLLAATPLSTRLSNYDAAVFGDGKAPKLVDFPPPIEAVACKPVLFDLALNKAQYPDLTSRCEKKKAGLMSWFGRK